jgi:hypothetical protein
MAISIQISPNLPENLTETQVIDRLLELRPHVEIYVISFFVMGFTGFLIIKSSTI